MSNNKNSKKSTKKDAKEKTDDPTHGWRKVTPRSPRVYANHGSRTCNGSSALINRMIDEQYPHGRPYFRDMEIPEIWARILPAKKGDHHRGAQTRILHFKRPHEKDLGHRPHFPESGYESRKVYIDFNKPSHAYRPEAPYYNLYNLGGFGISLSEKYVKELDPTILPSIELRHYQAKEIGENVGFQFVAEMMSKVNYLQSNEILLDVNGVYYRISSHAILSMASGFFKAELERRTEQGLVSDAMDWMAEFENALMNGDLNDPE